MILPKVDPKMILNPVIDCNMPPYPEECILRANRDGFISDDPSKHELFAGDQIYTINTPNPADDFFDNFVPQTLPTFGNLKNESFIKPAPFIELDPENNFLLPSLIGLILIGYFILK